MFLEFRLLKLLKLHLQRTEDLFLCKMFIIICKNDPNSRMNIGEYHRGTSDLGEHACLSIWRQTHAGQ